MATIKEMLESAEYNIRTGVLPDFGMEQLRIVITLIDKGYDLYDEVEEILDGHKRAEDVPEKEED